MLREDLTEPIIGAFYDVVNDIGFGFVESVYEACMVVALNRRGLAVERQKRLIMRYHGVVVGRFKADLIVENAVMVELKACRAFDPAHEAQLLNYMNACTIEVGLLLLFAPKPKLRRLILTNDQKPRRRRSTVWSVSTSRANGTRTISP
jgi:GxxExxY protein